MLKITYASKDHRFGIHHFMKSEPPGLGRVRHHVVLDVEDGLREWPGCGILERIFQKIVLLDDASPMRLTSGFTPSPDDFEWELYNIAEDFSQAENLAAQNPKKLRELQDLWWAEAAKYNVLPLDSSFAERVDPAIRPSLTRGRNTFSYRPGMIRIPEGATPDIKNKSYTITAEVVIPESGANGVLATQGGRFCGWGFLVLEGKPMFVHALSNQEQHKYKVASKDKLTTGKHTIRFDFKYDGGGIGKGGTGTLLLDGQKIAEEHIPETVRARFSLDETFDVGEDNRSIRPQFKIAYGQTP